MFEPILHSELLNLLRYEPETGLFFWKVRPFKGRVQAGDMAGSEGKGGYRVVKVAQHRYPLHRLAWFYVHGEWPKGDIDHINGVRADNRLTNLRDVSRSVNLQNQKRAKSHNVVGLLGVRQRGERFGARINVGGHDLHLGYFDTAEQAHHAYVAAKRQAHEGCTL